MGNQSHNDWIEKEHIMKALLTCIFALSFYSLGSRADLTVDSELTKDVTPYANKEIQKFIEPNSAGGWDGQDLCSVDFETSSSNVYYVDIRVGPSTSAPKAEAKIDVGYYITKVEDVIETQRKGYKLDLVATVAYQNGPTTEMKLLLSEDNTLTIQNGSSPAVSCKLITKVLQ